MNNSGLIKDHYFIPQDLQHRYRELFKVMISDIDIHRIRAATNKNFPLGDERLKKQIEQVLGRRIESGLSGRPGRTGG